MAEIHVPKKHKEKPDKKEEKQDPYADKGVKIRRNAFMVGVESGLQLTRSGKDKQGELKEWADIKGQTIQEYSNFLESYVTKLNIVYSKNPDIFDQPAHKHDKALLDVLLGSDAGRLENHKNGDDALNKKIASFLQTRRGLEITTLTMEQAISQMSAAVGIVNSTDKPGERGTVAQNRTYHTGENQGVLNRVLHDKILPNKDRVTKVLAGTAATGAGALIGGGAARLGAFGLSNPIGVIGGGLGAAAIAGLVYGSRGGEMHHQEQSEIAFNALKGTPEESFIQQMYGVDMNNSLKSVVDSGSLQNEVKKLLDARAHFYRDLGVDKRLLDRMPEESILKGRPGGLEKNGTLMQQRILQEYDYDPNLNAEDNLKNYYEARTKVLADMGAELVSEKLLSSSPDSGALSTLQKKIEERENNDGRIRVEKIKEFTQEKELNVALETMITTEEASMDAYNTALTSLDAARTQILEFTSIPGTSVKDKLDWITEQKTDIRIAGSYAKDFYSFKKRRTEARDKAVNALVFPPKANNALKEKMISEAGELVDIRYAKEESDLNIRLEKLNTSEEQLKSLQATIKEQEKVLLDTETVVGNSQEVRDRLTKDFSTLYLMGISTADLSSLSPKDLLAKINQEYEASVLAGGAIKGWPEEENGKAEHRQVLENARIHAKAEELSDKDPDRHTRQSHQMLLRSWGISENQLRVMTKEQIFEFFNKRHAATGKAQGFDSASNGSYDAIVENAMKEAKLHFANLRTVMKEEKKQLSERNAALDKEIAKADFSGEVLQLTMTKELLQREAYIRSKAFAVVDNTRLRQAFMNDNPVDATDMTYSAAEKEQINGINPPKGYYEFLNLFFDAAAPTADQAKEPTIHGYQNRTDRESYYKKISKFMTPETLSKELHSQFSLAAPADNLAAVLKELGVKMGNNDIDGFQFSLGLKDIIDKLQANARALS